MLYDPNIKPIVRPTPAPIMAPILKEVSENLIQSHCVVRKLTSLKTEGNNCYELVFILVSDIKTHFSAILLALVVARAALLPC